MKKLLATFKSIALHVDNDCDQNLAPIDTTLQQLKDLAQITKDVDRCRVLENVLIAAMNLRQILLQTDIDELNGPGELAVTLSKHEGCVYYLASSIACLNSPRGLSDEEQQNIFEVFRAADQGSMRLPLQIALFISPLALLVPVRLHATRYSQANMVLVSEMLLLLYFHYSLTCTKDFHALGNSKPPLVLLIEKTIIRTLFNIASGKVRIKPAVQDLVVGLPWAEIDRLAENDPVNTWFKPGTCKKSALYHHRFPESALAIRFIETHALSKYAHLASDPRPLYAFWCN